MTEAPWRIGVIIPARNEEKLLPRCLKSVVGAVNALPADVQAQIILVSDSSSDRTAEIAARLIRTRGKVLSVKAGVVGTARALGASFILDRYIGPLKRLWLANTDADCVIPRSWLATQLHIAEKGVMAVAGTVSVDSFREHGPQVVERFRATYRIDPDGSHPHIHGANLGVRADAYVRAGGWSNHETAEDHDLWGRLLKMGAVTQSTNSIEVATSGRRVGRAPHGFAEALARHGYEELTA